LDEVRDLPAAVHDCRSATVHDFRWEAVVPVAVLDEGPLRAHLDAQHLVRLERRQPGVQLPAVPEMWDANPVLAGPAPSVEWVGLGVAQQADAVGSAQAKSQPVQPDAARVE